MRRLASLIRSLISAPVRGASRAGFGVRLRDYAEERRLEVDRDRPTGIVNLRAVDDLSQYSPLLDLPERVPRFA